MFFKPSSTGSSGLDDPLTLPIFLNSGGNWPERSEGCVISTFQVAGSMGFKGDFRQGEDLLRIGD
jgi:hypothetical protein